MNTTIVNWGVIGCGKVAEVKSVPAYQKVRGFNVFSVMRRRYDLALDYAKRHKINHTHRKAEDLINDSNVDAVYIATPPDSHLYYALKVAEAGKICCIEKPLSSSYKDGLKICRVFSENKLHLFTAYYRRSLPIFNKIKTCIAKEDIGSIRHISWSFCRPASEIDLSKKYNWRTDADIATGGYFDDLASHGLDIFAYLFGDFREVKGLSFNQQKLYSSLDSVSSCWIHEGGITGSGSWNFGGFRRQDEVTVVGNEGEMRFSIFNREDITLINKNGKQKISIKYPEHIQYCHVENMRKALAGEIVHPSSGETALHTSWVMDKILNKI